MVGKSKKATSSPSNKSQLIFRIGKDVPKWYLIEKTTASPSLHKSNLNFDKENSEKFYQFECDLYRKIQQDEHSSDYQWLQTSLSTTAKDRLAALVTLIRRSPIHAVKDFESLIDLLQTNIQHRRDALTISEIVEELFINTYLPENRRLVYFEQQTPPANTKSNAILDFVEDRIKHCFSQYIDLLQQIAHDPIGPIRMKAVATLHRLLSQRPEQEKHLLELIVDKLGDPDSTVASKTLHLLNKLLEQHPGMKTVLINEIERLIFRKNIRQSAQHYGLCVLTAITFTSQDDELANKLIRIYFALFRLLSVQENVSSKFFAILLAGVTRAISFAQVDLDNILEHLNDLFRIVHCSNFKTSVRALQLLFRISEQRTEIDERYYNALYKKISEPELKNSKMLSTFLNLIFKSMLKDVMDARVRAFSKRLLQLCLFNDVPFVCAILLLLSELSKRHSNGENLFLFTQKSNELKNIYGQMLKNGDDDEVEHFRDVDQVVDESQIVPQSSSWDHKTLKKTHDIHLDHYDLFKRNPLYCGSDLTCLHELLLLKNHSHPTVALFAEQLINGKPIEYDGNPLIDFNSMRFFDRFIYKNPKKQIEKHEILRQKSRHTVGRIYLPRGVKAVPVDSNEYLRLNSSNIPADERFLYTFMKMRKENSDLAQLRSKSKSVDDIDDNESIETVSDDEFDSYLDQFMGDVDNDEIDLDEGDRNNAIDIASTVEQTSRSVDTTIDESELFTLNENDELSDDEPIDDDTVQNQHIRDNFKADNQREIKQIQWELNREKTYKQRTRRYERNLKKTSRRKPKLTRREKRRQLNETKTTSSMKKKRVRFS